MSYAIAIDGPAGAGKSTIARHLAQELHLIYVDTGALYRAIGYRMLRAGIDPADTAAVVAALPDTAVSLHYAEGEQRVFLGEEDVSGAIRTPEVSMAASAVSAIPAVRQFLLQVQRDMAAQYSVIMDGRDIGTTILPRADVKIFLTASAEQRAQRRYLELTQKGEKTTLTKVLDEMQKRDKQDSTRACAPLKPARDAVLLDTSELDVEQSAQRILEIIREKLA